MNSSRQFAALQSVCAMPRQFRSLPQSRRSTRARLPNLKRCFAMRLKLNCVALSRRMVARACGLFWRRDPQDSQDTEKVSNSKFRVQLISTRKLEPESRNSKLLMELKDRIALITGGGRGIGRAIAFAFASKGARVAVAARSQQQVQQVANEIDGGTNSLAVVCDVSDVVSVQRMFTGVNEKFGRSPDILVNNAGIAE